MDQGKNINSCRLSVVAVDQPLVLTDRHCDKEKLKPQNNLLGMTIEVHTAVKMSVLDLRGFQSEDGDGVFLRNFDVYTAFGFRRLTSTQRKLISNYSFTQNW